MMQQDDSAIRVSFGELIDYISSDCYKKMIQGLELDISFFIKVAVDYGTEQEKVLGLIYFVYNYQGMKLDRYFSCLDTSSRIINARLCDIPVLTFAKLNRQEIADKLIELGAKDIITKNSQNELLLEELDKLLRDKKMEKINER